MSFSPPKPFFNALVGERGHRKACVRDAEPTFLVGQHDRRCLYRMTFVLGDRESPCAFDAVLQDHSMHIAHVFIERTIFRERQVGLY